MESHGYKGLEKFMLFINSLHSLVRTGWMLRGVPASIGETVSQHSFSAALIAVILGETLAKKGIKVNVLKAATMALIHDIAEAFTGDIITPLNISERQEIEEKAILSAIRSNTIKELFKEFEALGSIEAKVAKLSDYIATYIQALYYKKRGYNVDDIINNMSKKISRLCREFDIDFEKEVISALASFLRT